MVGRVSSSSKRRRRRRKAPKCACVGR